MARQRKQRIPNFKKTEEGNRIIPWRLSSRTINNPDGGRLADETIVNREKQLLQKAKTPAQKDRINRVVNSMLNSRRHYTVRFTRDNNGLAREAEGMGAEIGRRKLEYDTKAMAAGGNG